MGAGSHCFVIVRDGGVLKLYQGNAAKYSILDAHNRSATSVREMLAPLVDPGRTSQSLFFMDGVFRDGVAKEYKVFWEAYDPGAAHQATEDKWRELTSETQ